MEEGLLEKGLTYIIEDAPTLYQAYASVAENARRVRIQEHFRGQSRDDPTQSLGILTLQLELNAHFEDTRSEFQIHYRKT